MIRPFVRSNLSIAVKFGVLAAILTLAGVLKPVLWDDEIYLQFAEYIARHPSDPYGAPIRIDGLVVTGMNVLAPPILLYWWSAALRLFAPSIHLAAIALLPFALAYIVSFHALSRRFAPGLSWPLTVMASLSAWALVSFNYMLDFPAIALGLSALALFIAGVDFKRTTWLIAAGIAAGLALETKYSASTTVAAIALYGALARRPWQAALTIAIACALFAATETVIFLTYGQSHFLIHLQNHPIGTNHLSRYRSLLYGLIESGGPLAIGILLIAPTALHDSRRTMIVGAAFGLAAFGLAALGHDREVGHVIPGLTPETLPTLLTLSGLLGLLWITQSARLAYRWILGTRSRWDRDTVFLMGWSMLAVFTYFLMSPFPAARRMGEILVVSTLAFGRAVALAQPDDGQAVVWRAAAVSAGCGFLMLAIVLIDGKNVESTVRAASAFMRANATDGRIWHLSGIATDRYFTGEGVQRIEFDRTELHPGDLLAVDDDGRPTVNADGLRTVAVIRQGVNLGVSVSTSFYRNQLPWVSQYDTRPGVVIYRASSVTKIAPWQY